MKNKLIIAGLLMGLIGFPVSSSAEKLNDVLSTESSASLEDTESSEEESIINSELNSNSEPLELESSNSEVTNDSTQPKKETENSTAQKPPQIEYRTHVEKYGWQGFKQQGEASGTSGEAKRLEAIQINIKDKGSYTGDIEYRTHIQNIGWEKDFSTDNSISGTFGQAKRLEAIQIKLSGELAENFDIYYRVHAQQFGWMGWAKNGEAAGTEGYAYRLEAIEIKLVNKNEAAPSSTDKPFQKYNVPTVSYQTHVQNVGWQGNKRNGEISGTSGKSLRLEGIKINLSGISSDISGQIQYKTHIQNVGWQDWKANGQVSGTFGQAKRLEAIQIKLTGELNSLYDVYYRVHAQQFGWMGWTKNGEAAGTERYGYRLEGIQIKLVQKNMNAPGNTKKPYLKCQNPWVSGNQIVKAAESFLGRKYACSQLVSYALEKVGFPVDENMIAYPVFTESGPDFNQPYHEVPWEDFSRFGGRIVPYSNARPGDILTFKGHVAIYKGNGLAVHGGWPVNGKTQVTVAPVSYQGKVLQVIRLTR